MASFVSNINDVVAKLTIIEKVIDTSIFYKGVFTTFTEAVSVLTAPLAGEYFDVAGTKVDRYIYVLSTKSWALYTGTVSTMTATQVKALYEGNVDTNVFDDASKSKLDSLVVGSTSGTGGTIQVVAGIDYFADISIVYRLWSKQGYDITIVPATITQTDVQQVINTVATVTHIATSATKKYTFTEQVPALAAVTDSFNRVIVPSNNSLYSLYLGGSSIFVKPLSSYDTMILSSFGRVANITQLDSGTYNYFGTQLSASLWTQKELDVVIANSIILSTAPSIIKSAANSFLQTSNPFSTLISPTDRKWIVPAGYSISYYPTVLKAVTVAESYPVVASVSYISTGEVKLYSFTETSYPSASVQDIYGRTIIDMTTVPESECKTLAITNNDIFVSGTGSAFDTIITTAYASVLGRNYIESASFNYWYNELANTGGKTQDAFNTILANTAINAVGCPISSTAASNYLNGITSSVLMSVTPALSGTSTATEQQVTAITITNFSSTAIYTLVATAGTTILNGNTVQWILPSVTADTLHTLTVFAQEGGKTISLAGSLSITVKKITAIADQVLLYDSTNISEFNTRNNMIATDADTTLTSVTTINTNNIIDKSSIDSFTTYKEVINGEILDVDGKQVIASSVTKSTGKTANALHSQNIYSNGNITSLPTWVVDPTAALPAIRVLPGIVVTSSRVYLLGGYTGTGGVAFSSTISAPINTDGTIGAWIPGSSLLTPSYDMGTVVTSTRVYLLGGHDGTNFLATIYSALLNADGTIGTFVLETNTLAVPLKGGITVVTSTRVYLLGGYNSAQVNTIYSAPLNVDGTIGAFVLSVDTLPSFSPSIPAVVTSTRVYLLGGHDGTNFLSTIYTAPLNADGTIGTFVIETSSVLPKAFGRSSVIVTSTRVYSLGGYDGTNFLSSIYSAPLNADGTIGTFVIETNTLGSVLSSSPILVTSLKAFLLGGGASGYTANVQTISFSDGWTVGSNGYALDMYNVSTTSATAGTSPTTAYINERSAVSRVITQDAVDTDFSGLTNITTKLEFPNISTAGSSIDTLVSAEVMIEGEPIVILLDDGTTYIETTAVGVILDSTVVPNTYTVFTTSSTQGEIPSRVFTTNEFVSFNFGSSPNICPKVGSTYSSGVGGSNLSVSRTYSDVSAAVSSRTLRAHVYLGKPNDKLLSLSATITKLV